MGDKFNVNTFLIDLYFHFNWFSKRHNIPAELCSFCDQEYSKITTFHSVWWFGLSECLTLALKLFPSLKCHPSTTPSPPKKNPEIKGREISVLFSLSIWSNSVVEVCCQFLNSALTLYANLNSLFQSHIPVICKVWFIVRNSIHVAQSLDANWICEKAQSQKTQPVCQVAICSSVLLETL